MLIKKYYVHISQEMLFICRTSKEVRLHWNAYQFCVAKPTVQLHLHHYTTSVKAEYYFYGSLFPLLKFGSKCTWSGNFTHFDSVKWLTKTPINPCMNPSFRESFNRILLYRFQVVLDWGISISRRIFIVSKVLLFKWWYLHRNRKAILRSDADGHTNRWSTLVLHT